MGTLDVLTPFIFKTNTHLLFLLGLSMESLLSIRRNVVALLTVLLPQLDMTGIGLESDDIDHVLQQVIDVNSLKVA